VEGDGREGCEKLPTLSLIKDSKESVTEKYGLEKQSSKG
jgi:hypothetical protein